MRTGTKNFGKKGRKEELWKNTLDNEGVLFSDMNLLAACWRVAGAPSLPGKHFPWVWQLELKKKKSLLLAAEAQVTTHS